MLHAHTQQQELDLEKETIELRQAKDCAVGSLGSEIPSDQPCFSFYRYDHTHAGTDVSPIGAGAEGGVEISFRSFRWSVVRVLFEQYYCC